MLRMKKEINSVVIQKAGCLKIKLLRNFPMWSAAYSLEFACYASLFKNQLALNLNFEPHHRKNISIERKMTITSNFTFSDSIIDLKKIEVVENCFFLFFRAIFVILSKYNFFNNINLSSINCARRVKQREQK